MKWTVQTEDFPTARGARFSLSLDAQPATFMNVIQAWQDDSAFCVVFNSILANSQFDVFRWETPPVTIESAIRPFEFMLIDSPELNRAPNAGAFVEHFATARDNISVFANLGGDALMVVPSQIADRTAYGHLAAFVRSAPETQQNSLWKTVGKTMARRLSAKPVWLSTAGAGVPWLHVRLDDRPKYYHFEPYRRSDIR